MNYRRLYNYLVRQYGRLSAGLMPGGRSPLPLLANCIVTYDCNLACPFCFAGADWDQQTVKPLDIDQWRAIFRQIPAVTTINLSGGEVLCHPRFFDLLREASAGHRTVLVTNGTMLDESIVSELVACGVERPGGKGLMQIGVSVNEPLADAEHAQKILVKKIALLTMIDREQKRQNKRGLHLDLKILIREDTAAHQIGRASCRERV